MKCIESVTRTQALNSKLSFEFKSDYITTNYKVLTIINIKVHIRVAMTVKSKNPILVHPAYSELIVQPTVSPTVVFVDMMRLLWIM